MWQDRNLRGNRTPFAFEKKWEWISEKICSRNQPVYMKATEYPDRMKAYAEARKERTV